MENSLWKRLCTCGKTDYGMNEWMNEWQNESNTLSEQHNGNSDSAIFSSPKILTCKQLLHRRFHKMSRNGPAKQLLAHQKVFCPTVRVSLLLYGTGWTTEESWFDSSEGEEFFSSLSVYSFCWYQWLFLVGQNLATRLHPVRRLTINGAADPFLRMPPWRAQNNLTFMKQ